MKKTAVIASAAALTGVFAATTVVNADTITVKSGDTVSELAEKYNTTIEDIVNTNKLTDANLIFIGQQLEVGENAHQVSNNNTQVQTAPISQQTAASNYVAPVANQNSATPVSNNEVIAREWIAARESGGNYNARNGQYIGKYQLSASYLNGDYSPANQENVANRYVASRYGSWSAAKSFWQSNGWY